MTEWLNAAARMPVAFAQVREDPRVDLAVLDRLGRSDLSGIMIASGGCTAAALVASERFARLHLVDANAAQLALTRLKLHLLQYEIPPRRLALLGHAPLASREAELAEILATLGLPNDALGPPDMVGALGPDQSGRYELLFAQLRAAMGDAAAEWPAVLAAPAVADAESVRVDPKSCGSSTSRRGQDAHTTMNIRFPADGFGDAMDAAFDRVMALDNLVALFGAAATQNSVEPFARHFARRTRHALATLPTADNPFLWQLLVGRFPPGGGYDWLTLPPPRRLPELTWSHAPMNSVLSPLPGYRERGQEYDFVHLSNILDWLTPAEAAGVLQQAYRAMKPGGLVLIRQLNSTLDLPALGPQFEWLTDEADALHAADRSFFYNRLHLGRRR